MKKKKPKPVALPVKTRQEEVSHKFRVALASNKPGQVGRPPFKLNEIISAVGDEVQYFVDACCDIRITTLQLTQAVRDMGVNVSYQTMLHIRKQVEQENRWFYQLLEEASNPEFHETVKVL